MTAIDWNARTARTRSFVAIFEAMRGAPAIGGAGVESLLETISEKREARESAWAAVWRGADLKPWLAGFMDESSFVRAVRLGYAKASDWKGKPEENPCYL